MTRISNSFRRTWSAFTLVELLVVIAVMALLVSLLLPAMGKARDAAMGARCLANERQIGVGILTYCADNGQKFPYMWQDYNTHGGAGWDGSNYSWGATISLINAGYYQAVAVNMNGIGNAYCPGIFKCPTQPEGIINWSGDPFKVTITSTYRDGVAATTYTSASADVRQGRQQLSIVGGGLVYTNYGFNAGAVAFSILGNYPKLKTPMPNYLPYGIDGIGSYQQAPLQAKTEQAIGSVGLWLGSDGGQDIGASGRGVNAVFRHLNTTANFVYLDGHVEGITPGGMNAGVYQTSWDPRVSLNGNSN